MKPFLRDMNLMLFHQLAPSSDRALECRDRPEHYHGRVHCLRMVEVHFPIYKDIKKSYILWLVQDFKSLLLRFCLKTVNEPWFAVL